MKILIINTSDIQGGAARAAYRLHRALLNEGIDSQMLVNDKSGDDYTILSPNSLGMKAWVKVRDVVDRLPTWVYRNRQSTLFSPAWVPFSDVVRRINAINPDVVHLHWLAAGMVRIEDTAKIKAPVVWSLHDNWAFTGGCHIMWDCDRHKHQCGQCPRLGSTTDKDLSRIVFQRKVKTFSKLKNFRIVGLSRWMGRCAQESILFNKTSIVHLPNPIDTHVFFPVEKTLARKLLKLPDKKLVLFGAMDAVTDINKGFCELSATLKLLNDDIELIVFGSSQPKHPPNFGFKTHYLGHLHDDLSLRVLYSAADVMVVPSLQENLSNAIMESLACGTPVVAFDVGGNSDMIEHQHNGYLARPFDSEDLAQGITWVLNAPNYTELTQNARAKVEREFDSRVVARQYIALYESLLNK